MPIEAPAEFMSCICRDMEEAGRTTLSHEMSIAYSELAGEMATNPEIAGVLESFSQAAEGRATFDGATCVFSRENTDVAGIESIEQGTHPTVTGEVHHLDGSVTASAVPERFQRGQPVDYLAISPVLIRENLSKQDSTLITSRARESASENSGLLVPSITEYITGAIKGAVS